MKKLLLSVALLATSLLAQAGGYLTNTNQNVAFLRNPAQDAQINLNSVYSNPAAVSFLDKGFHLGINWQAAWQTREVITTFAPFAYGVNNQGEKTKTFTGKASAPFIPSVQAAWVKDRWNLHLNLAFVGGGGKANFAQGLPSFESQVALLALMGRSAGMGFDQYSADINMQGRQYFFGLTIGGGYKINNHLSLSAGVRGIYGNAAYEGQLANIKLRDQNTKSLFGASTHFQERAQALAAQAAALTAAGSPAAIQVAAAARSFGVLSAATQDLSLDVEQKGFGLAPILGLHYHNQQIDFAAKYEFATRLELTNKAHNSPAAANSAALAAYQDGLKTRSDIPALLTFGVQYRPTERLRINGGYHHYFDQQAKSGVAGNYRNEKYEDGTHELLFGLDYAVNNKLEVSAGVQRTIYPNTDAAMNDVSFNVNSTSVGLGFGYQVNDKVKLNVAYFQSFYNDYKRTSYNYNNVGNIIAVARNQATADAIVNTGALQGSDTFTRTNRVLGLGVEIKL